MMSIVDVTPLQLDTRLILRPGFYQKFHGRPIICWMQSLKKGAEAHGSKDWGQGDVLPGIEREHN